MTLVVLRALWSHWARHPVQLFALVTGLAMATGLWIGVQAINAEARTAYGAAAQTIGQGPSLRLVRPGGGLRMADFVALRRAGWLVSPVVQAPLRRMTLMGVDPLTAPLPGLGLNTGAADGWLSRHVFFAHPSEVNEIKAYGIDAQGLARIPRGQILADVENALAYLGSDELSWLSLANVQPAGLPPLSQIAPDLLQETAPQQSDIARLTDSFHLNLTAFGLLAFAVGLFIVQGAIGLAFEQRRPLFRTLRALGVSSRRLVGTLALELGALALVSAILGIAMGYGIAAALLPGVSATLQGLYGASVGDALTLSPLWWISGLGIALAGAGLAGGGALWQIARMPPLAPARPRAWMVARGRRVWAGAVVGLALIAFGTALALFAQGLIAGFACLGALLIGAALCLPIILRAALSVGQNLTRSALMSWVWADTRQQLPGLSLALMALMLALAANIGVSTMVGSFRGTFTGWLDQRLASELYVTVRSGHEAAEIRAFLAPRVDAVLPIISVDQTLAGAPGEVFGIVDHATYHDNWPLLEAAPDVWAQIAAGTGVLVNEQMARREGLWPGTTLDVAGRRLPVAGVYSDYGNPSGQAIIGINLFGALFPEVAVQRLAVRTTDAAGIATVLETDLGLSPDAMVDQARIKAFSLGVFERTFLVTGALNVLTLGVAAFALWASLSTLAAMRLPQLAPVWALGVTRRTLAVLELTRTCALVFATLIVAIPVGLVLAWVLLAVVNVAAFGWRLPMQVFPLDWLWMALWAGIAGVVAAAKPVSTLARISPARLVAVFANAR